MATAATRSTCPPGRPSRSWGAGGRVQARQPGGAWPVAPADLLGSAGVAPRSSDQVRPPRRHREPRRLPPTVPRCHAPRRAPRRELGVPTVFNFWDRLANPARCEASGHGVADPAMAERDDPGPRSQRRERAPGLRLRHHGADHHHHPSVHELRDGEVRTYDADPVALGLGGGTPDDLRGGDAATNAALSRVVLAGERRRPTSGSRTSPPAWWRPDWSTTSPVALTCSGLAHPRPSSGGAVAIGHASPTKLPPANQLGIRAAPAPSVDDAVERLRSLDRMSCSPPACSFWAAGGIRGGPPVRRHRCWLRRGVCRGRHGRGPRRLVCGDQDSWRSCSYPRYPYTAIIPERKDDIGRTRHLVQGNFLSGRSSPRRSGPTGGRPGRRLADPVNAQAEGQPQLMSSELRST